MAVCRWPCVRRLYTIRASISMNSQRYLDDITQCQDQFLTSQHPAAVGVCHNTTPCRLNMSKIESHVLTTLFHPTTQSHSIHVTRAIGIALILPLLSLIPQAFPSNMPSPSSKKLKDIQHPPFPHSAINKISTKEKKAARRAIVSNNQHE